MEKLRRSILNESTLNICLENKDQISAFFSISEVESLMFNTRMIIDRGVSGKCTTYIHIMLFFYFSFLLIQLLISEDTGGSLVRGEDANKDTMETQT